MLNSFSPSINIIRDENKPFGYIPTVNAKRVFNQIVNDYQTGFHCFNIIGSYGTGKSAFLLALTQNLHNQTLHFGAIHGQFGQVNEFQILPIVGEYNSIITVFAKSLGLDSTESLIEAVDKRYQEIKKQQACWVILIDEFGKFLEYSAQHDPERELYFIQQLAEYVNKADRNILLITTLHQGFDSYRYGLNQRQREEWEKVKGRLKELTFNEPVEQLVELAAKHLETKTATAPEPTGLLELIEITKTARIFSFYENFTLDTGQRLRPFDPLTVYVLALALQRYGQNERSLFTFLHANDRFGINDSIALQQHPYYNLVCTYDYLLHNHYALLSTAYNPDYLQWGALKGALERVEAVFERDIVAASHLVKVVGLLNIFAEQGVKLDKRFLTQYAYHALAIPHAHELLDKLENLKIIRFVQFKQSYVLFEGTDLNIEWAIVEAGQHVSEIRNVVTALRKHFEFPYILAKAITYLRGTPRFFEFRLSDSPIQVTPEDVVDGFINLIFSETISQDDVALASMESDQAILYGWYRQTKQIKDILREIDKIDWVMKEHKSDPVAMKYLDELRVNQVDMLNRHVLHSLYQADDNLIWFFGGEQIVISSEFAFNKQLSRMCEVVYSNTPVFRNELLNRHNLSSAISTARSNFIKALVNHWAEQDLGFKSDNFPPEKTIYLSLLQNTGIHRLVGNGFVIDEPTDPSFAALWQRSDLFLESAKSIRKTIKELVEALSIKPFKLKQGFLEAWLVTFFFIKREEYALYHKQVFVPNITVETLDLIRKEPHNFQVKTFDVQGIRLEFFNRYRAFLQQPHSDHFTQSSFLETIKPFLTFYRNLPDYAKQTKKLQKETLKLREVLAHSTEPDKLFFEDMPQALGFDFSHDNLNEADLDNFTAQLQESIRELRSCFDELLNRLEAYLLDTFGYNGIPFPDYKANIKQRYQNLKPFSLLSHQKAIHMRLLSELDDQTAWLKSIGQVLLGKNLEQLRDQDESLLFNKFSQAIRELDNLSEVQEAETDPQNETVVKVEISTLRQSSHTKMLRIPQQKRNQITELVNKLEPLLVTDGIVNQARLLELLQNQC